MSNVQTKQLYFHFGISNKLWHRFFMYEIKNRQRHFSLINVAFKCTSRKREMSFGRRGRLQLIFKAQLSSCGLKRLFCIWWLFLLLWSTEAKQYLLVVSLGMFLEKGKKQQVRHAAWQNKLYCKSLIDQRQVRIFTYHNSLLQRLPKAGLVFRADLFQVHLTAWHNNSGHYLLFGSFTLRKRAQVST